ncbi:MAG: hypothetical protein ABIP94_22115 [Planctomycetota bacterium]
MNRAVDDTHEMVDDAPQTGGDRSRCVGWLSAVVLFVLLAAAGMPATSGGIVHATQAELGIDRGQRAGVSLAELVARAVHAPLCADATPAPRVLPRARSVRESGLPQPRAPTA